MLDDVQPQPDRQSPRPNAIEEALHSHPLPPALSHFALSRFSNRPELLAVESLPGVKEIKRVAAADLDKKSAVIDSPVALVSLVVLNGRASSGALDPSVTQACNVIELLLEHNERLGAAEPSRRIVSCDFKLDPKLQQSPAELRSVLGEIAKKVEDNQILVFVEPDASLESNLVGLCKTLDEMNQAGSGCVFGLKTRGALPGSDMNARLAEISTLASAYSLPLKVRDLSWQTSHDTHCVADFVNLSAATRIASVLGVTPEEFVSTLEARGHEWVDANHPSKKSGNVGSTFVPDPRYAPSADKALEVPSPKPLGATVTPDGVHFAVLSSSATKIELCLFDSIDAKKEIVRIPLAKSGDEFSAHVKGLEPGQLYGFRVHGPHHNPNNLVLDPYAKAVARELRRMDHAPYYKTGVDTGAFAPLSVVIDDKDFDWREDRSPEFPLQDTVIVELNVRSASMLHPGVKEEERGTFAGLTSEAMLKELRGIANTVELMPPAACQSEGRYNLWGYNTAAANAPDPEYCKAADPQAQVREFKEMVRKLHAAGFKVIADVVYNHTSEGTMGPTIGLRGLDPDYYLRTPHGQYIDYTGCGNTLNMDKPAALRWVIDSLAYWKEQLHVDGFRFDEAPVLAVNNHNYNQNGAFFQALRQHPALQDCVLIAEPWSCGPPGQSYQLGQFPREWSEWNGKFRDDMREFWKGTGQISDVATRIYGSSDLFQHNGRGPAASINFITAHDGFTLVDLWSYCHKHNLPNGEYNRDGIDHNRSWNCGVEGPTGDAEVNRIRERLMRASMATLMLSSGIPMITLADVKSHSQQGNNNAYCQDNPISWINYDLTPRQQDFEHFVRGMYEIRERFSLVKRTHYINHRFEDGTKDVTWINPNGDEMQPDHWKDQAAKAVGVAYSNKGLSEEEKRDGGDCLFHAMNAHHEPVIFKLPPMPGETKGKWEVVLDTARENPFHSGPKYDIGDDYMVYDRAMTLFRFVPDEK